MPHVPDEATKVGCGLGSTAAVHSGFSVGWGTALKQAVCTTLHQAVQQSGRDPTQLRVLVTGQHPERGLHGTCMPCVSIHITCLTALLSTLTEAGVVLSVLPALDQSALGFPNVHVQQLTEVHPDKYCFI